jgi:hypothetical protein
MYLALFMIVRTNLPHTDSCLEGAHGSIRNLKESKATVSKIRIGSDTDNLIVCRELQAHIK